MGLILLEGIRWFLPETFSGALDGQQLRALASTIATGNLGSLQHTYPMLSAYDPSGAAVHAALVKGFGWVMLYGGVGAWILAVLSFLIFGSEKAAAGQRLTHAIDTAE